MCMLPTSKTVQMTTKMHVLEPTLESASHHVPSGARASSEAREEKGVRSKSPLK